MSLCILSGGGVGVGVGGGGGDEIHAQVGRFSAAPA